MAVNRCNGCGGVLPGPNGTGSCTCVPEDFHGCKTGDCPHDKQEDCDRELALDAAVVHPAHYGGDTVYEVIKVLRAWKLDECAYLFNVVKYVARAGKKDPTKEIEDLEKAAYYLQEKIEVLKGNRR